MNRAKQKIFKCFTSGWYPSQFPTPEGQYQGWYPFSHISFSGSERSEVCFGDASQNHRAGSEDYTATASRDVVWYGWKRKERRMILWFCSRRDVFLWQLRTSKFRHTPRLPFLSSTSSAPPSLLIHTFPPPLCSPHQHEHGDMKAPVVKISTALPASDKCQLCMSAPGSLCVCVCVCMCVCVYRVLEQQPSQPDGCQKQVMIQANDTGFRWVCAHVNSCVCFPAFTAHQPYGGHVRAGMRTCMK